ncbi:hypothetical protein LF41_1443 [Lysobacter dokdonensis DS-58]|uniref:DUF1508 domain containing protein n=1 Tax=Lysobacter dokdonensis DS-58 TaxID=1300345 RepID=A0A0A2WYM5_9GAMM|nr:hypothetical protein [Lysobacter dokdonensis]KGQ18089.1 hypothetical protein LF41_1443 [Lysobacter dokdonensis DS-58]
MQAIPDYPRQFILSTDTRNRWRWFLFDDGMKPVARAFTTYRTYDACIEGIRQAVGIAQGAAVWDAELQRWDEQALARE